MIKFVLRYLIVLDMVDPSVLKSNQTIESSYLNSEKSVKFISVTSKDSLVVSLASQLVDFLQVVSGNVSIVGEDGEELLGSDIVSLKLELVKVAISLSVDLVFLGLGSSDDVFQLVSDLVVLSLSCLGELGNSVVQSVELA